LGTRTFDQICPLGDFGASKPQEFFGFEVSQLKSLRAKLGNNIRIAQSTSSAIAQAG
jgi:hypothetical protein